MAIDAAFSIKSRVSVASILMFAVSSALADAPIQSQQPPVNGEIGFVLTEFAPAIYQKNKDECPDGFAGTLRENYLDTLSPEERERLSQKANEAELTTRWKAYALGPNGTNVCTNVESFNHPTQKIFQGKVAYGLNLGGTAGDDTCAHEKFTSPSGEANIDNQAYRAMGCTRNYRGVDGTAGDIVKGFNMFLATGEHTMVLLLRDVQSFADDDSVEVILASTNDRPILDSKQNFIANASFTINPQWRNVLHGRIVDGVLTTDPLDIHLRRPFGHGGVRGQKAEWDLRKARLRLALQADGSIKGLLGAYQTPRNVIQSSLLGGIGAATVAGIDCSAQYETLEKLADGLRDPQTGQCTALSTALQVAAIPAYVFDREPVATANAGAMR
jgi:hypothetical protein